MTQGREPFLLGIIGAVLGIGLAVIVFGGGLGGGSASASASPALPGQSVAPSPSLVAVVSGAPTPEITVAPATVAPATVAPATAAPTPKPTRTPRPTPTPNTNPAIVTWDVPKQEDCTNSTGGMIRVSWTIKRATGVTISIDGPGIYDSYAGLTGEVDLPYGCSQSVLEHTYTLTTVGGTGPAATSTKTVRTRAPSIVSFVMGDASCSPGDNTVGISMSYEIRAATGAELWRGDQLYSTYSGKTADLTVQYDCSKASEVWRLTTTGGYGDPASKSVTVQD